MTRWRRCILLAGLLAACSSGDQAPDVFSLLDASSPPVTIDIRKGAAPCEDCLRLVLDAALGDTALVGEAPGLIEEAIYVERDDLGRFWVGQPASIKVFDSAGGFLREVGRPGQGPLEFKRYPEPLYFDDSQRLHVIDRGNGRETVIGADFQLVETHPFGFNARSVAKLPGSHREVMAAVLGDPTRRGKALHILDDARPLVSFGGVSDDEEAAEFELRRKVTSDRPGRIFSAPYCTYEIIVWNAEGSLLGRLSGPTLNRDPVQAGSWTPENPPPNRILALRVDDENRLWVLIRIRKDGWRDHMVEEPFREGRTRLHSPDGLGPIYGVRLDVIDLGTGGLIATQDFPQTIVEFAGAETLFENAEAANGAPILKMWRIEFREP